MLYRNYILTPAVPQLQCLFTETILAKFLEVRVKLQKSLLEIVSAGCKRLIYPPEGIFSTEAVADTLCSGGNGVPFVIQIENVVLNKPRQHVARAAAQFTLPGEQGLVHGCIEVALWQF